ncbi:mannosyltransferase family protein [Curtobacterium ammoniigenes]|uniref:mannosyltransferase family protein n=1 Tax=Curtobacterium ammoniigenes TaxID=395387 RepID=UPI000A885B98|nr:mannosyltransferase family protein [Curtobacterium ammoniigenes]
MSTATPSRRRSARLRFVRIALEARHSRWAAPLTLWVASRIVSTTLLALMFGIATAAGWSFASHRSDPSFLTFSGSWDASFYRTIAEHGYPTRLPRDAAGTVLPNPWAFLPVFPAVVRAVMLTGASFWLAGVIVATLCGAGAAIMLYRLVATTGCSTRARRATALFVFGPMGFLLQVSYAESMFLLLVFAALLALTRQRYWLVAALGVVAAFTRPGVLALAVALAVELVVRWVRASRGGPRFGWDRRVAVVIAGLVVAAAGLAWPLIAGAVTGVPSAYLDTELSWWTGFVGRVSFHPFAPWFLFAGRWLGVGGIALVLAILAAGGWFFARREVRRIGLGPWAFVCAYGLYLVAVFLPQQSLPRLLMPMAPALGSDVFVGSRRRAVLWLAVGLVLQPVAIVLLWFLGYP